MACSKCKKDNCCCNGGGNSTTQLSAQISQLSEQIDALNAATLFLQKGHPILEIYTPDDISAFNTTTGYGSGTWAQWGLCNGTLYTNPVTGVKTQSPNLLDKFIVAAGGTYAVGDTGGAATVSLVAAQNGQHTHTVTDPGHTHTITDPGHDHTIVDVAHTHGATSPPHNHSFTTSTDGDHNHGYGASTHGLGVQTGSSANKAYQLGDPDANTTVNGAHHHTGNTDMQAVSITVASAFTGISETETATTGITNQSATTGITINDSGAGAPHENLPPFFALCYVIKL